MTSTINNVTKDEVVKLYQELLRNWNDNNAKAWASLFADDGLIIGFDGSQANGPGEIYDHLSSIFAQHRTGIYISIVRDVKYLAGDVALLRADAGMITPGRQDVNPALNVVQTLIVKRQGGSIKALLFQNTPAAFHNRPDLKEEFTNQLRKLWRKQSGT